MGGTLDTHQEELPDHNAHEPPEQASNEGGETAEHGKQIRGRNGLVMALKRGGEVASKPVLASRCH